MAVQKLQKKELVLSDGSIISFEAFMEIMELQAQKNFEELWAKQEADFQMKFTRAITNPEPEPEPEVVAETKPEVTESTPTLSKKQSKKQRQILWEVYEKDALILNLLKGIDEVVRLLPHRSLRSIITKAERTGVYFFRQGQCQEGWRIGLPWEKNEIELIKTYYPLLSKKELGILLGRSEGSVNSKLCELSRKGE